MSQDSTEPYRPPRWLRCLLAAGLLLLALLVSRAVLELPPAAEGLRPLVSTHLPRAGASNPVTAVLMNFRGYDTLLELVVLLLAGLATLSATGGQRGEGAGVPQVVSSPVLDLFVRVLTPLTVMVGAYLLWVGSKAPGGAFQAGAVLAAAGVLLVLSRFSQWEAVGPRGMRAAMVAGLLVFVFVGTVPLLVGRSWLEYPVGWAGELILLVEAASTVSIAAVLAMLFLGRFPTRGPLPTPAREESR